MGTLFEWEKGRGLYVGLLPGRTCPWLAIQDERGLTTIGRLRNEEDEKAFLEAMYKLLDMKTDG